MSDEVIMPDEVIAPMNFEEALQEVVKLSLVHDGLARGLKEAVKALDRKEAHLCILASSCDETGYTKLISALCKEHSIPLVEVAEGKTLGEWAGLCRIDAEGNPVKVVGCSCVVIKSWGEESAARLRVLEEIKKE